MLDRDHGVTHDDDAFIARVAAPLRAPERVDSTFGERVMSAVHADIRDKHDSHRAGAVASGARRGWLHRGLTLRITPIAGLAMAAGLLVAAAIGTTVARRGPATTVAVAQRDTVFVVRFVFVAPSAQNVSVVGDFNNWDRATTALTPTGDGGLWTAAVTLPPGRHEYAFIVDGTRWTADPLAPITIHDDFGTASSIVTVGTRAS